jgi:CRISPR-associated endoribonuclease Cas6
MPIAVVFTVRPHQAVRIGSGLGRATYMAVLGLITRDDRALADQIHDDGGLKPLTVSSIMHIDGGDATGMLVPEQTYAIRVTALSPALETLAATWPERPPTHVLLDTTQWQIEAVTADPEGHPWAGRDGYADLAAPGLTGTGRTPQRWELLFDSPVTFRQRGMNQPFPLPELVFGSLLERWNSVAPLPLPDAARDFVSSAVAVSAYDLHSVRAQAKTNAPQIGALGRCTYTATRHDQYGVPCLDVLARFAFYCGVGAATTRGFGRVRRTGEHTRKSNSDGDRWAIR